MTQHTVRRRPALVVIYNHQFNENIARVEELYSERFPEIFHLVPFFQGHRENVIPVFEHSYYFHGYVAQAWRALSGTECDDFLFVADDLLLNPVIDHTNYRAHMGVDDDTSFVPTLHELHRRGAYWSWAAGILEWDPDIKGIEVTGMLPSAEEAMDRFDRHGLRPGPVPAYVADNSLQQGDAEGERLIDLPYPLIGSYSDVFAVPRGVMEQFVLYCGIFAATRLFVEAAIPSALALSSPRLTSMAKLRLKGRALWTQDDMQVLDPYCRSISRLASNFPEDYLYLHPIKLSQWTD